MKLLILLHILFIPNLCQTAEYSDAYNLYKKDPQLKNAIRDLSKSASETWKNSGGSYKAFLTQDYENTGCVHCPSHIKLTGDINQILSQVPLTSEDSEQDSELLPIKLNKLKFLYYISKSDSIDSRKACEVYIPLGTKESLLSDMKGSFTLAYEDILPYENIVELQLYRPDSNEVVYFYRGEGAQSNVFIEATLRPHGKSTFRYFYYTPPETINDKNNQSVAEVDHENKESIKLDTFRFEHKGILPRDFHFIESEVKTTFYDDFKLNAKNDLAVTGNKLNVALENTSTHKPIASAMVKVSPSPSARPDFAINVPYEIGYYKNTQVNTNAKFDNGGQAISLTLTDHNVSWLNAEIKKDTTSDKITYYVDKVTHLGPTESLTTGYGKDFTGDQYLSLQHKKSIKNNTSMVLDVRYGINGQTTLVYQFEKKF